MRELTELDAQRLSRFEDTLSGLMAEHPIGAGIEPRLRSQRLAFPVSVKGVAVQAGRVVLLRNERDEWELPGGKLELGEDPPVCVAREISEETGWQVTAGPILDCWQYHIGKDRDVLIVTYGCHVATAAPPTVSNEHKQAALFGPGEVNALNMPGGYKRSILAWFALLAADSEIRS
jgi:8-oxo-dGTP pyrophosphatase MutT (NUDIX family)